MRIVVLVGLLVGTLVLGCSDSSDPVTEPQGSLSIQLHHQVDGVRLEFGELLYTNAAGDLYSVDNLMYYLSRFSLSGDGVSYSSDLSHYVGIDAMTPDGTVLLENVPAGQYTELSFIFGLNDDDNVTDGLPATLENLNMAWPAPMGGGYHYMKLEGFYQAGGAGDTLTYRTHTGRNGSNPHFIEITLQIPSGGIGIGSSSELLGLVMNINEWYTNPFDYAFPANAMIMANVGVQDTLEANGATAWVVEIPIN